YDRNPTSQLRQDRNDTIADDNNDVRIQRNEIRSVGPYQIHVARRPTLVELNIPALGPSQPCQFLPESPNVRLRFRVTFRVGHQDANPPHLTGLLPPRRERPRSRRSSNSCNEIASSHWLPQNARPRQHEFATQTIKSKICAQRNGFKVCLRSSNLAPRMSLEGHKAKNSM